MHHTVDSPRNPARKPVEVGSLNHYLQGFIHSRWCRISSINSITVLSIDFRTDLLGLFLIPKRREQFGSYVVDRRNPEKKTAS